MRATIYSAKILFLAAALLTGVLAAVWPVTAENALERVASAAKSPTKEIALEGVGFRYDSAVFTRVTAEKVAEKALENSDDKPDGVAPQHILFRLKQKDLNREATIAFYPVADFRRVWVPAEKNSTKRFDQDLSDLKKAIADTGFRVENQIPYLPFVDASQAFQAKVKKFSLPQGEGIFFITQIDAEPSLVNNEGLRYIFQGLSADGKHYVLAEFPVGVAFLPADYEATAFEGYRLPDNFFADRANRKAYQAYVSKIRERLDALPSESFEPNLRHFEAVISSLKIAR